ncbi:hypothetical protein B0H10DRAFT_2161052 [Mycena sp. CBHHK59/15]|nr:hypothetical protein B0H10DRAFT_2161052 [Mycena sp. CBHHK59/15]
METLYGPEHGAYIWGRSVHNIHIERLWCDVTRGFGRKWSNFFHSLELSSDWAKVWNEHKIRFDNERTHSPRDLFFFGMIQNGLRGFDVLPDTDEEIKDLDAYSIDWEELHNEDIMGHHAEHNTDAQPDSDGPHRLSHIEVQEPLCLFSAEDVALLDAQLAVNPHSQSCNMNSRRSVWIDALAFCRDLYEYGIE